MLAEQRGKRPLHRVWLGLLLTGALLLGIAVFWWSLSPLAPSPQLVGQVVASPPPASDFTLLDQLGQPQALSAFRGKPVVLTFLYTNCPDACPLIADNLHAAAQELGLGPNRVALLAVTVDPERDTVAQARRFSDLHGLSVSAEWHFLTGARPLLQPIWKAYGITAQPLDLQGNPLLDQRADAPAAVFVDHAAPVVLIDQRGRVRVLLPPDFAAADLVADLKVLLAES